MYDYLPCMRIFRPIVIAILAASSVCAQERGDWVACVGRIVPNERVQKLAPVCPGGAQAVVKELKVKIGDEVKEGDVVAVMAGEDAAKAALAKARAALEVAKTAKDIKILQQKNLIADLEGESQQIGNVISEKDPPRREREELEYNQTTLARRIAQSRAMLPLVESNQAAIVSQARAAADEAQAVYESYFVKSPVSGRVLDTHVKEGEAAPMEGICEIADTSKVFVEAEVYVSDVAKVKVGQKAQITCDALDGKTFDGCVVAISRTVKNNKVFSSDPSDYSNLRVVRVKIELQEPAAFANIIGSQVNVRILAD